MSDEEEEEEEEVEHMDIYKDEEREEMLKDDEITVAEYGFMEGREKIGKKKKLGLEEGSHDDSVSVEFAKKEYEED